MQDIGFRNLIEDIGRLLELGGYVFNASDGSVRTVCRGENSVITKFFKEIQIKFSKLYSDEISEIGRKLDIGVDVCSKKIYSQ